MIAAAVLARVERLMKMQSTLIFVHVPKCGGTSLQMVFKRQFSSDRLIEVGTSPGKIREPAFRKLSSRGGVDCDGFSGHIPYGMGAVMKNDVRYMTMLRDPVQRYVSQYSDVLLKGRRCVRDHLRLSCIDEKRFSQVRRSGNLDLFLNSPFGRLFGNMQTRYLAGVDGDIEVNSHILESALVNLDKMACVGLTDRFDESLLLMAQCFGWRDINYERSNISNAQFKTDISNDQERKIRDLNRYDLKLYAHACDLFGLQVDKYQGNLDADLDRFRQENRSYKNPVRSISMRERLFRKWMKVSGSVVKTA